MRTTTKAIAFFVFSVALCWGDVMTASLPDYNGVARSTGFPFNVGSVGTFTYSLPAGATIDSATLSGTWGTAQFSTSTAAVDLYVEGVDVGGCAYLDPNCWYNGSPLRPFSFSIPSSVFADLADGNADLSLIQTNQTVIRVGGPTLTIDFTPAPVPEPTSIVLLVTVLGIIGVRGCGRFRTGR
jgi:hypothetical protein